jgi:CelD/BcsL family acetyltransferase involved in cellulose biosynthesis
VKDLGEPREASRFWRRNNRAFGSLPYQTDHYPKAAETNPLPRIHRTQIFRTLDDLESLRPAWEALLEDFSGATTFSTWEWLAPWWRAFGEGRELLVLAFFDESERLVGLAPLQISRRRVTSFLNLRVLGLWGDGSGDSDNLDIPVRAGWEESVTLALLEFLKKESSQWDFCEFNTMPEDSPVASCLAKQLGDRGWTAYNDRRASSAIALPETWEAYLSQLSSKERGKVAYYQNRLQKKYRMHVHRCEAESEIPGCLEALFKLHRERWQALGQSGSFESAARRQFYCDLARLLNARNRLEFWLLELDRHPVAAQFGFRHGNTVFQLQEGFDLAYSADSVGYVLRAYVIEQQIAQGVRRYDFLAGEAPSKSRWATQASHYLNVQFARPLGRGSAYLHLIHGAGSSKEWLRRHLPSNAWQVLRRLNAKTTRQETAATTSMQVSEIASAKS